MTDPLGNGPADDAGGPGRRAAHGTGDGLVGVSARPRGRKSPTVVLTCGIVLIALGPAMVIFGLIAPGLFPDKAREDVRFIVLEQSAVTMMRLGIVATVLGALVAILGAVWYIVHIWVSHRVTATAQRPGQHRHATPVPLTGHVGAAPGQSGSAIMLGSGLMVTVAALVALVVGFSLLTRLVGSMPEVPGDGIPRTIALEEDTAYWLQGNTPWGTSPCTVTGPDDAELPVQEDRAFPFAIGIVTPITSGAHTITCTVSKPVLVGRLDDMDALMKTSAATVAGGFGLVVGPLLALAGFLRHRKRTARMRTSASRRG